MPAITIFEYRFVAPGWTHPEGKPVIALNVGDRWPEEGREIVPEHLDWFAMYLEELAKEWAAIRDRGDHMHTNASIQTDRREPTHALDQRCICAERAADNEAKTRTAERTQLVRVTIYVR